VAATAFVLLAAMVRNHPVDARLTTLPLALPPAATAIAEMEPELLAEDLQVLGAVAPPSGAAADGAGKPAAPARDQAPAVVAVATAPETVRKVIVGKGKRVVRHVPVAPPKPVEEATPATRTARFDMSQNGRRMTADEFDAWMKAQGIRVASGAAKPAAAPTSAGIPAAPAVPAAGLPASLPTTPSAAAPAAACTPQPDKTC
jgi:hypothetical protein